MNISPIRSSSDVILDEYDKETLAVLPKPMRTFFIIGLGVCAGYVIIVFLTLNGFLSGDIGVVKWAGVWAASVMGFACILGLVFIKPLALWLIMSYREKFNHQLPEEERSEGLKIKPTEGIHND